MPPADPLRPVNPNNARHPRITAAAGTWLAVAFLRGTVIAFVPLDRGLRPEGLRPSRGIAPSGLPIAEDSRLQPPVGVWAVSQSQCG